MAVRKEWDKWMVQDVRESPAWQVWAAQGWELRLAQHKGRIVAVHEGRKLATPAVSGLNTVLNWLLREEPNYYHYLKTK